ncbi:MAG TPA: MerR family transcriptional regulator [Bdellovibrio sp.]
MMMTTSMTTTMNSPESLEIETSELSLGDQHIDFVEKTELVAGPLTATAPISIPAMLCDDKLLEEINSIPDKMGFKIGDVAEILGIKQYVLRYWETEFEVLRPKKASNNQRMYTRKDVENALLIRKLLHRDRFSIEGARNAMKELKAHVRKEKDMNQVFHRLENFNDRVEDLILDIRKVRQIFR